MILPRVALVAFLVVALMAGYHRQRRGIPRPWLMLLIVVVAGIVLIVAGVI